MLLQSVTTGALKTYCGLRLLDASCSYKNDYSRRSVDIDSRPVAGGVIFRPVAARLDARVPLGSRRPIFGAPGLSRHRATCGITSQTARAMLDHGAQPRIWIDVTLPNRHLAVIEERKITDYLLNGAHPDNGGKARYFHGLGFSAQDITTFIRALRHVAETGEVAERVESAYGVKFVVDGALPAQVGKSVARTVRTVWIIERGESAPRLVTAYPSDE